MTHLFQVFRKNKIIFKEGGILTCPCPNEAFAVAASRRQDSRFETWVRNSGDLGWANIFYGGPHWKFYCYRCPYILHVLHYSLPGAGYITH